MTTADIVAPLTRAAAWAGRWFVRRLIRWRYAKLVLFIECRIDTFTDRIGRARSKARKRWLRWRIRWRRRLLAFLKRNRRKLTDHAVKATDKAIRKLPWDVAGERFETWKRKHAKAA